jgi:hypothetical protein
MGLTNTFKYKGITLSASLDFRYGGHMYSYTKDYMHWTGSGPETVYNDRNIFIVPNSVKLVDGEYIENDIPVSPSELHTYYSKGANVGEQHAVIDKSFLKLRNINLSYSLPSSFCNKLKVSAINLSLNAGNILLWTPAENAYIDPEATTFGNDIDAKFGEYGANPTQQTMTFGVNVTF